MAEMRAELVGLLIEKHGERAKIKLDKDKSKGEKIPKYLEAWCPINAKVGDVVGVEYQEMNKRKMQMILYGFPVLSVMSTREPAVCPAPTLIHCRSSVSNISPMSSKRSS